MSDGHARRIGIYFIENVSLDSKPFEEHIFCSNSCRLSASQPHTDCQGASRYHLRPNQAFFALKRELALVTVAVKRLVS